jgi:hypothetical protein
VISSFYQAFAPTSFTLLGLWLIVVQTRHAEWRRSARHRRRAYAITLDFAFPGLMGLLSLVDPSSQAVWRASFASVAILGALALGVLARAGGGRGAQVTPLALLAASLLYAVVAVVAIAPGVLSGLGIALTPLRAEAILLSVVVFLGVNVAWLLMFDETEG